MNSFLWLWDNVSAGTTEHSYLLARQRNGPEGRGSLVSKSRVPSPWRSRESQEQMVASVLGPGGLNGPA